MTSLRASLSLVALILATSLPLSAQEASDSTKREIEAVKAHAIYKEFFSCSEHAAGDLPYLGDDLGQDCSITRTVDLDGRELTREYKDQGFRNEDYFGWGQQVLSPCDCVVTKILINPVTNEPGKFGKPPASMILLRRADGVRFALAHIQDPAVKKDDAVKAGQVIAKVGNNGYGRAPHIHIGAWKDKDAFQIRWDLKTLKGPQQ
ncbi:M23 family metallopeptidase [Lysobacter sp. Root690]|uniref:M23 family metallopeptidase n=1 Tax=Lysobacter sp. Root690 TaxID=1736588 RepID=UPI00138F31F9|nr:M23 family metallopeptidase [Lysobacter sp. Root690]